MKYLALLLLIITTSCQKGVAHNESLSQESPNIAIVKQQDSIQKQNEINENEHFTDDSQIGKRKLNRAEISHYKRDDRQFIQIKFYAKSKSSWIQKNEVEIEKFGELPIAPEIKDFNGDGFKDITLVSGIAARGANDVRALFIYDPRKDELIHIINSTAYPNLGYNPLLKCLDAWIFTGSTTTVFLKLNGNKLVEFASVDDRETERTIKIIDRDGKERLLRREKRKDDGFDRYLNFNPIQTY